MAIVYLSLGSNLGNRRKQLIIALAKIAERAGDILALSGFYETEPWGFQSIHSFLNVVAKLETSLSPHDLLSMTQQIERELGRKAKTDDSHYEDRLVDIDILLYDDLVINASELIIPHPLMHQRLFVLEPLAEIAPKIKHPVLDLTIAGLLKNLKK